MAKQKPPKPITVEHEKEREYLMSSSPSVASGVVTPTFAEHVKDLTKSALSPRKRPIMVTNSTLGALAEDGEESINIGQDQPQVSNQPKPPKKRSFLLLRSNTNLKRTSTVRRKKPSPPISNSSTSSIPLKRIFKSKVISPELVTSDIMPETPLTGNDEIRRGFYQAVQVPPTPSLSRNPSGIPSHLSQAPLQDYHEHPSYPLQSTSASHLKIQTPHQTPRESSENPPNLQQYTKELTNHGVPQTEIALGTSPVLLVRKRTTTRNIRGSPVRNYFRRLFRRKSKSKYNFTKEQLNRQLSFEVISSPRRPKPVKFKVRPVDILKLHPTIHRTLSSRKHHTSDVPILSPRPINPMKSSPNLLNEFDTAHPPQPDLHRSRTHRNHTPISEGIQTDPVLIPLRKSTTPPTVEQQMIPPRRSSKRKTSLKRLSSASKYPIIRRIDVFGSDDPGQLYVNEPKGSTFDDPVKIDEALNFVNTWSIYLRRAIAVRVILRQEIHSWELEEEREWRKSYEEYDSTKSIHNDIDLSDDKSIISTSSDSSGELFSDVEDLEPKLKGDIRRQSLRQSLDETRISSKYGSLVGSSGHVSPNRSSSESIASLSKPGTESLWLSGKRYAPRPLPEPPHRLSADKRLRIVSLPPVFATSPLPSTTTETTNVSSTGTTTTTTTSHTPSSSSHQHTRKVSGEIVTDMKREIQELKQRTDQFHDLFKTTSTTTSYQHTLPSPTPPPPPPPPPTTTRTASPSPRRQTSSDINRSSSGGSDLKRGGVNRRRPRSRSIDNRRISTGIESSWSKYDSESSGGTPKSNSSFHFHDTSIYQPPVSTTQ